MRRADPSSLALAAAAVAAVALPACQSTQETSARRARAAKSLARETGLHVGRLNPDARVLRTVVLHDASGTAAVVEVRNGARPQAAVPVGLAVRDARGRVVYRNDAPGLEPSLVRLALLPARARAFWVDNQIPPTSGRGRAIARLGVARGPAPSATPRLVVSGLRFERDSDGVFVQGVVTNRSPVVQRRLVIACLARRRGRIVAAGRAIVDRVAGGPGVKPVRFTVYFIGTPTGARLTCAAPPTVLH